MPNPPKAKPISEQVQRDLTLGVQSVISDVDQGTSPDDAIIKQAKDRNWGPNHCRLAAQAFNMANQEAQRRTTQDVHMKFASFPVAHGDYIVSKVWPQATKKAEDEFDKAVDVATTGDLASMSFEDLVDRRVKEAKELRLAQLQKISQSAGEVKTASDQPEANPIRESINHKIKMRQLKNAAYASASKLEVSRRKVASCVRSLLKYCDQDQTVKLAKVEKHAHKFGVGDITGHEVSAILNTAFNSDELPASAAVHGVKRADDVSFGRLDPTAISDMQRAVYAVREAAQLDRETQSAIKKAADYGDESFRTSMDIPLMSDRAKENVKQGGILQTVLQSGIGAGTGATVARSMREKSKEEGGDVSPLSSSGHQARIRAVRAQGELERLIAEDRVLGGYGRKDIYEAYNQVAQTTPNVVDKPLMLRAALVRALAAPVQSFEAQELGKLNETAAKSDQLNLELHKMNQPPSDEGYVTPAKKDPSIEEMFKNFAKTTLNDGKPKPQNNND